MCLFKTHQRDFPGGLVVKTALPLQGQWVWSLVGELRFCVLLWVWLKETTQNTFHGWFKYMLYIKLNERWFPLSIAYWLIEEWRSLAVIWKGRWYSQEHCGCAARGPRVRSIPPINGGVRRALEEVALKPWEDAGAGVLEEGVSLKDLGILLFYV